MEALFFQIVEIPREVSAVRFNGVLGKAFFYPQMVNELICEVIYRACGPFVRHGPACLRDFLKGGSRCTARHRDGG
jgi:hypothetical protein